MADHAEPLLSANASGHARMRFKDLFLTHVSHGLPWALLLTFVTIALHNAHVLDPLEGWSMRTVSEAAGYRKFVNRSFDVVDDPNERVLVLEVSSRMRAEAFETPSSTLANDDDIDRVGGVLPVDRIQLAKLIESVADRLREPTGTPLKPIRPSVVAIDVDVVPIGVVQYSRDVGDDRSGSREIRAAITKLRQSSHVILINLSRPDINERNKRNRFLVDLGCTGLPASSRKFGDGVEGQSGGGNNQPVHGLYIASPSLFYERFGYPLNFPGEPRNIGRDGEPGPFPSLANLIHLRLELDKEGSSYAADDERISALTRICREASVSLGIEEERSTKKGNENEGLLLEDRISGYLPEVCADNERRVDPNCARYNIDKLYEQEFYNWRVVNTDHFRRSEINCKPQNLRPSRDSCEPQIPDEIFSASAVVLGVNGGDRHDRFDTPLTGRDSVGGATVHAIGALSQRDPLKLKGEHYGYSVLVDLVCGVSFVLLWSAIASAIQFSTQRYFRRLAGLILAFIPPLLAGAIGNYTVYYVSPKFLNFDIWINPLYVLLGLCIHAYSEAWNFHVEHSPTAHWPDFTMGWRGALSAIQVAFRALREKGKNSAVPHRWVDFFDRIALPYIVASVSTKALAILFILHPQEYGWLAGLATGALLFGSYWFETSHRR